MTLFQEIKEILGPSDRYTEEFVNDLIFMYEEYLLQQSQPEYQLQEIINDVLYWITD